VAQAYGGGRFRRASQATWTALWASVFTTPVFAALALLGAALFAPFEIPAPAHDLALEFWLPRMLGAPLGVALWAVLGFFNGIGRPLVALQISVGVAVVNAIFNQLFMFELDMGVAGSAWATGVAQLLGLVVAMWQFLAPAQRRRYRSHQTYVLKWRALLTQFRLGLPMGMLYAADILGFSLFQLMQVRLGVVNGAATQIVMMLTSFCYMPAVGIAMAGTTLVGQSIGAGHKDWAYRLGNGIIVLSMAYMGVTGLLLALCGPWIMPIMLQNADADSAAVIAKGSVLLWIAAGYQLFDGLQLGSGSCLRGAGDAAVPAGMVIILSWIFFVPAAYILSFAPGQGWFPRLPALGYGAVGGWFAALGYICALGFVLSFRWRSGAWRRIEIR
jgi:multidrug resistance protein, MATE family